jgi:hypothetical protein
MADVKMDWNDSAFAEIAKSAEVQAELEKCAQRVAKVANYDAQKYSNELYEKRFKVTPFAAGSKILNNTAIGYAYPNSEVGRWMQAAHKCLSKQIH